MGDNSTLSNARIGKIIFGHPTLKPDERSLAWAILANRNEETGLCNVEQGRLAKVLKKDRHWVNYRVGKFQKLRLLVRVPDRDPTGRFTVLRYYFLADIDRLEEIAAVRNSKLILDDLLCIPFILKSKNYARMKPLLEAAEAPLF